MSISEETLREAIGTLLGRLRAFEPEDDDLAIDEVIAALPHLAQSSKSDVGHARDIADVLAGGGCYSDIERQALCTLTAVRAEASAAKDAEIAALREALTDIAVYGCGMLNQPAAMNGPEETWLNMRIREYERRARAALEMSGGVK